MTETWTCNRHLLTLPRENCEGCPTCLDELEYATDPEAMTGYERAAEIERWAEQLTVPFDVLHRRIEALVGRPVWTHELGSVGLERLMAEARMFGPARGNVPTPEHLADAMPDGTQVIVVRPEDA